MTRRKQTKPRSLKREGEDEEDAVAMETLDAASSLASPDAAEEVEEKEEDAPAEMEPPVEEVSEYKCESCGCTLHSLTEFMDHRNFDCPAVAARNMEELSAAPRDPPANVVFSMPEPAEDYDTVMVKVEDSVHVCQVCSAVMDSSDLLAEHIQKHHQDGIIDRGFRKPGNMAASPDGFKCDLCMISLATAEELEQHKISQHNPIAYAYAVQCIYCGQVCLGQKALKEHIEQSHGKDNRCPLCNSCFPDLEVLYQHFESQHINTTPVPPPAIPPAKKPKLSPRGSSSSNSCTSPVVNNPRDLSCPYCKREGFSSEDVMKLHIEALHEGKFPGAPKFALSKSNTCPHCNATYPTLYGLEEHMRLQHPEVAFVSKSDGGKTPDNVKFSSPPTLKSFDDREIACCTKCKMGFTSKFQLSQHITKVHSADISMDGNSKSFTSNCTLDSNKNKTVLVEELRALKEQITKSNGTSEQQNGLLPAGDVSEVPQSTTGGEEDLSSEIKDSEYNRRFLVLNKRYRCTSCSKCFSKPDELQKHLMDIHAHHLYRCALCKEIFDSKVNIQIHFAIKHSDEQKIFACSICGSEFLSEEMWSAHVKLSHVQTTVSSKYRCLFCQETFATEIELQVHLTTHKKPFICTLCNESFHVEFLLDKHMEKYHLPEGKNDPSAISSRCPLLTSPPRRTSSRGSHHPMSPLHVASPSYQPSAALLVQQPELHIKAERDAVDSNTIPPSQFSSPGLNTDSALAYHLSKTPSSSREESSSVPALSPVQYCGVSSGSMSEVSLHMDLDQIHKCMYCQQAFKNKQELDKHVKLHASPSNRKCNICDEVFQSASSLAEHKLQHCKVLQGNLCTMCKVAMRTEEEFYSHTQQHGFVGTNMQCVVCRQSLTSALELQMHGKHHFQGNVKHHTCYICLKNFDSTENLISKISASSQSYYVCKPCFHGEKPQSHPCSKCDQEFDNLDELESHMTQHAKSYQCIKCQQTFTTEQEIQLHVASHVLQEGNVHECKICRSKYDSPAKLQCHLIEHSFKGKEFQCYVCGAVFHSAAAIQVHALEHRASLRQYSCNKCSQSFFFSAELRHHMSVHEENVKSKSCKSVASAKTNSRFLSSTYPTISKLIKGPVGSKQSAKCCHCPMTFSTAEELKAHQIKVHDGSSDMSGDSPIKTHQCPKCNREFPSLSALQGHTWVHNTAKKDGDKKKNGKAVKKGSHDEDALRSLSNGLASTVEEKKGYSCPTCKKTFTKKFNLKTHMRTHQQNSSFVRCDVCLATFSHVKQLQRHLMSAHKKSTNAICQICNELFFSPALLQNHMKTAHKLSNLPPPECISEVNGGDGLLMEMDPCKTSTSTEDLSPIIIQPSADSSGMYKDISQDEQSPLVTSVLFDNMAEENGNSISIEHCKDSSHPELTDCRPESNCEPKSSEETKLTFDLEGSLSDGVTVTSTLPEQLTVS